MSDEFCAQRVREQHGHGHARRPSEIEKKYNVIGCATKKEISETLWGLRKHVMEVADVEAIKPFLKPADQRKAQKLIHQAERNPIQSYMGLWKPKPMPVAKMTRQRIVEELRKFRDAWEAITTRSFDLDDERLREERLGFLRRILNGYYSENNKRAAEYWLRNNPHGVKKFAPKKKKERKKKTAGARGAPSESATLFAVGTKRQGLDGETYYIISDKNGTKRWAKQSCLFVVYEKNGITTSWSYPPSIFASGTWWWVGSGSLCGGTCRAAGASYPTEEQFCGNPTHTKIVRTKLASFFTMLKQAGSITRFRVLTPSALQRLATRG